jgi:hypothetical protein
MFVCMHYSALEPHDSTREPECINSPAFTLFQLCLDDILSHEEGLISHAKEKVLFLPYRECSSKPAACSTCLKLSPHIRAQGANGIRLYQA